MTSAIVLGLVAGAGVLLIASPFLWPAAAMRRRASPRGRARLLRDRLAQAGLDRVGVPTVAVVSVLLGVAGAATVEVLLRVVPVAIAAGLAVAALPLAAIGWRARARRRATRVVWPDVVDHLVAAVRSGVSLPEGVAALARTGPEPTRAAFASFADTLAATGRFDVALDELEALLADPVADRILETLRMAREVGGTELPAVLRSLSAYLRQEEAVRAEVEARQSWVRNAARLGVAAPWIVLALLSTRPEAAVAYNSAAGVALILIGLAVTLVAYRIMVRIGRLPEPQRWRS